jgi:hypothetical protein
MWQELVSVLFLSSNAIGKHRKDNNINDVCNTKLVQIRVRFSTQLLLT